MRQIVAKAAYCGVHIAVAFEAPQDEFDCTAPPQRMYSEPEMVDRGLAAAEAEEGFARQEPIDGEGDGKGQLQEEVFDMLGNIQNLSYATNQAITTHIDELAAVEELTTQNTAHFKSLTARMKKVGD